MSSVTAVPPQTTPHNRPAISQQFRYPTEKCCEVCNTPYPILCTEIQFGHIVRTTPIPTIKLPTDLIKEMPTTSLHRARVMSRTKSTQQRNNLLGRILPCFFIDSSTVDATACVTIPNRTPLYARPRCTRQKLACTMHCTLGPNGTRSSGLLLHCNGRWQEPTQNSKKWVSCLMRLHGTRSRLRAYINGDDIALGLETLSVSLSLARSAPCCLVQGECKCSHIIIDFCVWLHLLSRSRILFAGSKYVPECPHVGVVFLLRASASHLPMASATPLRCRAGGARNPATRGYQR